MATLHRTHVENTRDALLVAARRLFTDRGYADVPAEELVSLAGLTRGALYHHFDGKQGLFEAVFEEQEREAAERIRDAMVGVPDPFDRADRASETFLAICAEDAYRHVALLQGPIALGWERWRELDHLHLGGIVVDALQQILDTGLIASHSVELLASAFYGALTELALTIAEAEDPDRARGDAAALQRDLLAGLRT